MDKMIKESVAEKHAKLVAQYGRAPVGFALHILSLHQANRRAIENRATAISEMLEISLRGLLTACADSGTSLEAIDNCLIEIIKHTEALGEAESIAQSALESMKGAHRG